MNSRKNKNIIKKGRVIPQQVANLKLRGVLKVVPVRKIRTRKEFEELFNED